jgi:UDP-glucose 4-epimerase
MRALVTGGAGFLGSHLVERLVTDGHDVRVLDDLSTGDRGSVHVAAELLVGDVADADAVARAIASTDVVFHLAAHRAVARSLDEPLSTDRANTHGTLTVLTAARDAGVARVVSASSSSVYGDADRRPTPESAPLRPRSPYAVSKLAGEHYCRVFAELFALTTVSLRYFNAFGPRQRPDSAYATVVPLFARALLDGVAPQVHGDGLQSRDFTFVDDVIDATVAAALAPDLVACGAYNVAGGAPVSLLELLDAMAAVLGVDPPEPIHVEARAGDVRHTHADVTAAAADLGWKAQVGLDEGLRRTIAALHP